MATGRDEWLREIADWKLEAADEDTSRYFYGFPGVAEVQSGNKYYIIGRKGSGKTAVAEHVRSLSGPRTFVRSLSFKNFPFNELYKMKTVAIHLHLNTIRCGSTLYTRPSAV